MIGSPLANHLWQSTLVAGIAWLVTLVLRRDRAGVRHAVWLMVSLKFLVPFALLVTVGNLFGWRTAPAAPPARLTIAAAIVSQPFPVVADDAAKVTAPVPAPASTVGLASMLVPLAGVWLLGVAAVFVTWFVRWRRVSAIVRAGTRIKGGLVFDALQRIASKTRVPSIALVESDASLEPGVFGIVSPVLVWPRRISEHLSVAQTDAILAHELAHVRRRDNLTAILHMAVEATFWFYPPVWWIGSRLVDERERACDEDVVGRGSEPQIYAESILKTCQFCIESPVACVAGVTGSDLRSRIARIITNDTRMALVWWKKCLVATTVMAALVVPTAIGVMYGPPLRAQAALGSAAATLSIARPQGLGFRVERIRNAALRVEAALVKRNPREEAVTPVGAPEAQAPAPLEYRQYRLGPQDVLKITVVDEPELSTFYRVDSDGMILFPYLNRIGAAGTTLSEFQERIRAGLAAAFIKNPQVRVEIEQFKSQSVTVTVLEALATAGSPTSNAQVRVEKSQSVMVSGEVRTPGKIPISGTMTVLEALAIAGSPTSSAGSELTIARKRSVSDGDAYLVHVNWRDLNLGKGTDVALQDGDIIYVPKAQTFYITGQVRNPANYVLEPGMTVQQAIAMAGGLTDRAAPNRIRARRVIDGKTTDVNVRMEGTVLANDVITVGERLF